MVSSSAQEHNNTTNCHCKLIVFSTHNTDGVDKNFKTNTKTKTFAYNCSDHKLKLLA